MSETSKLKKKIYEIAFLASGLILAKLHRPARLQLKMLSPLTRNAHYCD